MVAEWADAFRDIPDSLPIRHLAAFGGRQHEKTVVTLRSDRTPELGRPLQGRAVVTDYYRSQRNAFCLIATDSRCRRIGRKL